MFQAMPVRAMKVAVSAAESFSSSFSRKKIGWAAIPALGSAKPCTK
jgi:hypothetical protein